MSDTITENGNKIAAGYAAMVADFVVASEMAKHDPSPHAKPLGAAYAAFAAGYNAAAAAATEVGTSVPFPLLPLPGRVAGRSPLDVLTLDEAAEYLQLPLEVVRDAAEAGRLPGRKLGGEWRFGRLAVVDWLRGQEPSAEPQPRTAKQGMLSAFGAWKEFGEDPEQVLAELRGARKAMSAKKR